MQYQQCNVCLMDTTASDINFNNDGQCQYCLDFKKRLRSPLKKVSTNLVELVDLIKKDGKGKPYDCVVGVSGGVDSSYTLVKVKELGLRPLAVHMDNGWNSELATNNIKNLVDKLNIDLHTHVIDWQEYKALMQAFFDADVLDVELLYDNAMLAVNYNYAAKYGLKYILSGSNTTTEGLAIPESWTWLKFDKKNIKKVARKNKVKLKTFPAIGTIGFIYNEFIRKSKWISFLNYLDFYDKNEALDLLTSVYDFKPYPYKHYESIFTRFYQGYILPKKFNVDKRKAHLSALVVSNQMNRVEALELLSKTPYDSENLQQADINFFLKKMNWQQQDLDDYIKRQEVSHLDYGSEKWLWDGFKSIYLKLNKKSS